MKESENSQQLRKIIPVLTATGLLLIFIYFNEYRAQQVKNRITGLYDNLEKERLPDTSGWKSKTLAFHDFAGGNPDDTASHISAKGFSGKNSLILSPRVPFSPGLWIRFRELKPTDSSWIRATGYVWISDDPESLRCSLVATCNHKGTNFKYMFIPLEIEKLTPGSWNKVVIDYRIPAPVNGDDIIQAYFWYRGKGQLLVDDIKIQYYSKRR